MQKGHSASAGQLRLSMGLRAAKLLSDTVASFLALHRCGREPPLKIAYVLNSISESASWKTRPMTHGKKVLKPGVRHSLSGPQLRHLQNTNGALDQRFSK